VKSVTESQNDKIQQNPIFRALFAGFTQSATNRIYMTQRSKHMYLNKAMPDKGMITDSNLLGIAAHIFL